MRLSDLRIDDRNLIWFEAGVAVAGGRMGLWLVCVAVARKGEPPGIMRDSGEINARQTFHEPGRVGDARDEQSRSQRSGGG